ncbi:MFS transporter [Streptomyces lacrimifluminis]|uniref:MFS transporter n=1 Tax=Streptomyces lacrimifluminis TaxID=1500077 RepID=A0A917PD13_9ACTN|nr:MFS transporter [Streptomyces lacrimifluminis]GGJ71097.1 MFS transporter [Streptomyces lacrimifluminis]
MASDASPGTRMAGRAGLGRPFRWLLASAAASNAGDGITRTLLPLLVVAHHPDPAAVAGLTAVNMLPWLLFALPAGVLVDRADRRRIVLGSNAVRAAALAGAAFVLAQDRPLGLLYALAFVLGIAETLADTAAPAMLPRLVDERHLERANGRLSAAQIVLNETAGPPVAGLLAGLTAAAALATGGALYALAALLLLGLAPLARTGPVPEPGGARSAGGGGGRGRVLKDIREGVGFVLRHRTLRLTLAASTLYGLVFSATFSMLVLLSDRTLGLSGTGYGLLLAAGSLGAVGGSWLAPRAADRLPTVRLAFWSLVASGVAYVLLGTATGPVLAGLALAANGVFMMGWNIPVMSLRQRLTPENLQGRVMSVSRLCAWGTMPLGALLGGLLAEVLSVPAVFVICGTVLAAGALLLLALLRDSPAVPGDAHTRPDPHTDLFDKG